MAYERIQIIGHISKAEALMSTAKNPYFRMSVGVNDGKDSPTRWYSVLMFGSLVKDTNALLAKYRPGKRILVEGRPQVEAFIKRDGSAGLDNSIVAISYPELLD